MWNHLVRANPTKEVGRNNSYGQLPFAPEGIKEYRSRHMVHTVIEALSINLQSPAFPL
jgi:hypothetical protein